MARQAGQEVVQLGELDLELALAGSGATREDVQDELGAINNLQIQRLFEVAELGGREVVVEDNQSRARGASRRMYFTDFAPPHQRGGIGLGGALQHGTHDLGSGAGGELVKFLEQLLCAGDLTWHYRAPARCPAH